MSIIDLNLFEVGITGKFLKQTKSSEEKNF
jgi:hypothetical protein